MSDAPSRSAESSALLAVAGSAALFGLTGTVAALGPDSLPPFVAGVWRSVIGGACLVALAWWRGAAITRFDLRNRTVVVLGVVTLTAAYVLWGVGLRSLSLSVVVTTTLIEPAVAAVLAVVVLGEPATAALALGLTLVAIGVRLSARPSRAPVANPTGDP